MENKTKKYDMMIGWKLTDGCNLDCEYCINPGIRKNVPTKVDIKRLIKTLDSTKKTYMVILGGGGETFLCRNFIELCKALTKKHYIGVITNLITPGLDEFIENIPPNRVMYVWASMHIKELEKKGLMKKFIDNVILLKNKGYNVTVGEVAYPPLTKDIKRIKKILAKQGINLITQYYQGYYNDKIYPQSYTKRQMIDLQLEIDKFPIKDLFRKGRFCNAGYNYIAIDKKGDVYQCDTISNKLGNIYKGFNLNDFPVRCTSDVCECPPEFLDKRLFHKAMVDNGIIKKGSPIKTKKHRVSKAIMPLIDNKIGNLGIFLKKRYPLVYYDLKKIKGIFV